MSFYCLIKNFNFLTFKNNLLTFKNINNINSIKDRELYLFVFNRFLSTLNYFFKPFFIVLQLFLITFSYGNISLRIDLKKNKIFTSKKIGFFKKILSTDMFEILVSFKLKIILIKYYHKLKKIKISGNFSKVYNYPLNLNFLFITIGYSVLVIIDINKKNIKRIKNFSNYISQIVFLDKLQLLLISTTKAIFLYNIIYNENWLSYKLDPKFFYNYFRIKLGTSFINLIESGLTKMSIYFQSGHFVLNQLQKHSSTTVIKKIYEETVCTVVYFKKNFIITISFFDNIKKWKVNILNGKIFFQKKIFHNYVKILHLKITKRPIKLIGFDYNNMIITFKYPSVNNFFTNFRVYNVGFMLNYRRIEKKAIKKMIGNVVFVNNKIFKWNSLIISFKNSRYLTLWSLEIQKRRRYMLHRDITFSKLRHLVIKIIDISENNNFIFLGTKPNMILKFDVTNCNYCHRILVRFKNYNINLYNFPLKIYTDELEIKLYSLLLNGEIIIWNLVEKTSIIVLKVKNSITSFFFNIHDRAILFISSNIKLFKFSINSLKKSFLNSKIINHIISIFIFKKKKNLLLISVDFTIHLCILKNDKIVNFRILRFLIDPKKNKFFFSKQSCWVNNRKKEEPKPNIYFKHHNDYVDYLFWINNKELLLKSNMILKFFKFVILSRHYTHLQLNDKTKIKVKILVGNFKNFLIQLIWYFFSKKHKKKIVLLFKPLITRHFLNFFIISNHYESKWNKDKILKYFFEIFYKKLLYNDLLLSSAIIIEILVFFSDYVTQKYNVFIKWSCGIFHALHKKWFNIELFNNILRIAMFNFFTI